MPTGYTHLVQTGEIKDFPTFAMQCARAFGALVLMRDDPPDAPIPDEFKPSDHNAVKLEKAKVRLLKLRDMTPEQINAEHRTKWDAAYEYATNYEREKELQEERYRAMLAKVAEWNPPSPEHDGLKKFMREQLESSIDFDCGGSYKPALLPADPDEWWRGEVRKAQRDIDYHKKADKEERERTEGRNRWVRQLRESLKVAP